MKDVREADEVAARVALKSSETWGGWLRDDDGFATYFVQASI